MQTIGPSRVAKSEICLVIVLLTLVLFLYFFRPILPYSTRDRQTRNAKRVFFLLSMAMNSVTMKGIGAGARQTKVKGGSLPEIYFSALAWKISLKWSKV